MTYKGIAKGKIIELEDSLPYSDGQPVIISLFPFSEQSYSGSPEAIRLAMRKPPHIKPEDIDELEQEIEKGKLLVYSKGVFDEEYSE
jgi:hypothetical protein